MNNIAFREFVRNYVKVIYESHNMTDAEKENAEDITAATPEADEVEPEVEAKPEDKPKEETDDIYTSKSMITLFNAIRSGQSMKNKEIVSSLEEVWDAFDEHHRQSFLSGLAKIAKIVSKSKDDKKGADDEEGSDEDIATDKSFDASLYKDSGDKSEKEEL